jgi:phage FluMu protein Com
MFKKWKGVGTEEMIVSMVIHKDTIYVATEQEVYQWLIEEEEAPVQVRKSGPGMLRCTSCNKTQRRGQTFNGERCCRTPLLRLI